MILEIPEIVRELVPDLFRGCQQPEVLCVRTTQPKYLVFNEDPLKPACIAQFGPKNELERLHKILARLHAENPSLVAEPLCLSRWKNGNYVHLQSGLAGTPWFRVAQNYRSRRRWDRLSLMALTTLHALHRTISSFPDWVIPLHLGNELREQVADCQRNGVKLSTRVQSLLSRQADQLDELGRVDCPLQHGDYCLNNLLVRSRSVSIIDFEEFGLTAMPFHDQVGLRLSLQELAPQRFASYFEFEGVTIQTESENSLIMSGHSTAFYLHYLVWRINQCHGWPTRAQAKDNLLRRLEKSAE